MKMLGALTVTSRFTRAGGGRIDDSSGRMVFTVAFDDESLFGKSLFSASLGGGSMAFKLR